MNAKKIITFTPYYIPFRGGLSTHAFEFDSLLAEEGYNMTVFTSDIPKSKKWVEGYSNNLLIIRFPAIELIPNFPVPKIWSIRFWYMFLKLFGDDYDIVISRIRFFNTTILAFLFSKIKRTPWVHIEHTSNYVILSNKISSFVAKMYDKTFSKFFLNFSDLNISISKAVQLFMYNFDSRYSPIIYRGLNFEEIEKILPNQNIKDQYPDKIILLTACRLIKWKGVDLTVATIKNLPKEIKERIVFIIIGDGEDYNKIKTIANNDPTIVFMGSMKRNDVIGIMKSAHIYIHSSLPGGGLSTSLLEAMYCGCIPIATTNEGASEIIKNKKNGILLEKEYNHSLIKNITDIVSNFNKYKLLKKRVKSSILENFNWKKTILQYKCLLENICKK